MDGEECEESTRAYNFDKIIPPQAGGALISTSDDFKYKMLEVAISEGSAALIDQLFFNEMAISNINSEEREYVLGLCKAAKMYLLASKTNLRSGRKYDLTMNVLSCYQRARAVCITTKGLKGWGLEKVMNPKYTQIQKQEQTLSEYTEKDKKKWSKRENDLEV